MKNAGISTLPFKDKKHHSTNHLKLSGMKQVQFLWGKNSISQILLQSKSCLIFLSTKLFKVME